MEANLRARTLSEARGFLKALVAADSDRILGFTGFGVGAGEIMSTVQIAMIAGEGQCVGYPQSSVSLL